MLFCLCAVALNYWIRFRYLNTYAQLKEPPLLKSDAQELHPDVNTTETPPAFHTYLDEFLQAVRIFGFLEKPVRRSSSHVLNVSLQAFYRFFTN
jgi:lysophospholipid hydrolase